MSETTEDTEAERPQRISSRSQFSEAAASTVEKIQKSFWERMFEPLQLLVAPEDGAIKAQPEWPWTRQILARIVGSNAFVAFMACVIMVNIIQVLIEADRRALCENPRDPDCSANHGDVVVVDRACFVIYVVELLLRLYIYQRQFCYSFWNMADALVVFVSLVGEFVQNAIQNAALIRLVRIVRVVRLLRVITMFQELYLMLASLASTMRTIFWAVVLLLLVLGILALVAVEVLNPLQKQIYLAVDNDECPRCPKAFSSVTSSMVTFFSTIIMGDGINEIFVPLIEKDATAALFILLSVAMVYLGFSNLVLSVIVEKAEEARVQDTTYQKMVQRKVKEQARLELLKLWQELDTDGSNTLTLQELLDMYESSGSFREYFKSMDIDIMFLEYAFAVMDPDGDGQCSFQDFAETVVRLKSTDPGPTAAFLKHQVGQVLTELSELRAQMAQYHPPQNFLETSAEGNNCTPSPEITEDLTGTGASRPEREPENIVDQLIMEGKGDIDVDAFIENKVYSEETLKSLRVAGRSVTHGNALPREDTPSEAAEELVELLKYAYEGPLPLNVQHLRGLEFHFADLCQRVEVQLGRLMAMLPDAQEHARLELFACSGRLLGSLGAALPRMLPGRMCPLRPHSPSAWASQPFQNSLPHSGQCKASPHRFRRDEGISATPSSSEGGWRPPRFP